MGVGEGKEGPIAPDAVCRSIYQTPVENQSRGLLHPAFNASRAPHCIMTLGGQKTVGGVRHTLELPPQLTEEKQA